MYLTYIIETEIISRFYRLCRLIGILVSKLFKSWKNSLFYHRDLKWKNKLAALTPWSNLTSPILCVFVFAIIERDFQIFSNNEFLYKLQFI